MRSFQGAFGSLILLGFGALVVLGCGGGGGGSTPTPPLIQPPAALAYSSGSAIYTKGVAIAANAPSSSGGAVVSYSVAPALPVGLSLNTTTGVISGTPTAITALATYTVTATNTGGQATAGVSITVNDAAPAGLAYATNPATYTQGVAIAPNAPSSSGGAVVSYSVSPALPAGLSLNTTTGVISGTPTAAKATATYTVTATNTGGQATAGVSITVNDAAPAGLAYATNPATYTQGVAIAPNAPSSSGGAVVSYSVSPALPAGLSLNTTTGVISGTPTAAKATAAYTVTATNAGGQATVSLSITVIIAAPAGLTYGTNPANYTKGVAIAPNNPSSSGGAVVSYSVAPPLPAGLVLNTSTGVISGTPTALMGTAIYAVTATNAGGNSKVNLSITVNDVAPSISYGNGSYTFTKDVSITTLTPSNSGGPVVTWSISPALPAGLNFATADGSISGTPSVLSPAAPYTVTATNSGGTSAVIPIISVVPAAPSISVQPGDQTIYRGLTATFSVTASGASGLSYQWSKGGVTIPGATSSSYTTPITVPADTGAQFSVAVSDTYGSSTTSAVATLTLKDPSAFAPTGPLGTPRQYATATPLPGGKVLVAGGQSAPAAALASAELYDPAMGTFSATGSLITARINHTATLLADGKVLIAGGYDSAFTELASAELYDPATGSFTATIGSLATARDGHTATLLPSGMVLLAGGRGSTYLDSAELYDPATGLFTATTDVVSHATTTLTTRRCFHVATLLPNGTVLLVAGNDGLPMSSAELYDPATGQFSATTGSLATARWQHTATLLPSGLVLVAGGENGGALSSAELYDPATGSFTATKDAGQATTTLTTARFNHTAILLPNGLVLLAGSYDLTTFAALASAELYDPATGLFALTGPLGAARGLHTATLLPSGQVLHAGGASAGGALATAELFQ